MPLDALEAPLIVAMEFASAAAVTSVGNVRASNEDRHLLGTFTNGTLVAVVADGMGGLAGGSMAAEITIETFANLAKNPLPTDPLGAYEGLLSCFYESDARLKAHLEFPEMGATVVAAYISPQGLLYLHAGDARMYHLRDGRVLARSIDHSVAQLSATLDPPMRVTGDFSSTVTSCVGGPGQFANLTVDPDWNNGHSDAYRPLREGDQIILCSDGLWNLTTDDEIAQIAFAATREAQACAIALAKAALDRGGDDNITVIVINVHTNLPELVETIE
ncbi:MAG TPA: PP2C family serine/threonine-protein phosphatase [Capsulimonadaceae bacterium]|jgi:serine/threonine protein phosphatase PrpC